MSSHLRSEFALAFISSTTSRTDCGTSIFPPFATNSRYPSSIQSNIAAFTSGAASFDTSCGSLSRSSTLFGANMTRNLLKYPSESSVVGGILFAQHSIRGTLSTLVGRLEYGCRPVNGAPDTNILKSPPEKSLFDTSSQ